MSVTIHDLIDAAGLGFQHQLATLTIELLNASLEPDSDAPKRAMDAAARLALYKDEPRASMPTVVLDALIRQLRGKETRYSDLALMLWTRPWAPGKMRQAIAEIAIGRKGK